MWEWDEANNKINVQCSQSEEILEEEQEQTETWLLGRKKEKKTPGSFKDHQFLQ